MLCSAEEAALVQAAWYPALRQTFEWADLHPATVAALAATPLVTAEELECLEGLEVYSDGSGVAPQSWAVVVLGWLPGGASWVLGYQAGLVVTDPDAPGWLSATVADSLTAEMCGVAHALFAALRVVHSRPAGSPIRHCCRPV